MNQHSFAAARAAKGGRSRLGHGSYSRIYLWATSSIDGQYVSNARVRWEVAMTRRAGQLSEAGFANAALRFGLPTLTLTARPFPVLPRGVQRTLDALDRVRADHGPTPRLPVPLLGFNSGAVTSALASLCRGYGRLLPAKHRRAFCRAAVAGMPLTATADLSYLGELPSGGSSDTRLHRFAFQNGAFADLPLPTDGRLYLMPCGDAVDSSAVCHAPRGACFGRAMAQRPSSQWAALLPSEQWQSLAEVCGGFRRLDAILQLWLWMQIVRIPEQTDLAFMPAPLVCNLPRLNPAALWWDFREAAPRGPFAQWMTFDEPLRSHLRFAMGDGIDVTVDRPAAGLAIKPVTPRPRRRAFAA